MGRAQSWHLSSDETLTIRPPPLPPRLPPRATTDELTQLSKKQKGQRKEDDANEEVLDLQDERNEESRVPDKLDVSSSNGPHRDTPSCVLAYLMNYCPTDEMRRRFPEGQLQMP